MVKRTFITKVKLINKLLLLLLLLFQIESDFIL